MTRSTRAPSRTAVIHAGSVESTTRFVDTWALALAEQLPLDADNCQREMTAHASALHALAAGWRTRRIEVGSCPSQRLRVSQEGYEQFEPCTGLLWAVMTQDDDGLLPARIVCDLESEHEWQPHAWHALGRALGVDAT